MHCFAQPQYGMLSRRHELIATFMSYSPFIFGCEGSKITPKERSFFRKSQPFGFILFARNLDNINQINSLCQSLRDATGRYVPIMVDQEGGRVARLGEPHWFEFPPALDQSKNINAEFWLAKDSYHVDAMFKYPKLYGQKMKFFFESELSK